MFTPLAKLAIGLSATMATAFYYLAVAPPAAAQYICGPGNFSPACGGRPPPPSPSPSPSPIADPVQEVPVVESPAPIADPVQPVPVIESPEPIADPVQPVPVIESPAPIADPVQPVPIIESPPTPTRENPGLPPPYVDQRPIPGQPDYWKNLYNTTSPGVTPPRAIPEPGTVVAILVTGAGILCSARKRNKQIRQQR